MTTRCRRSRAALTLGALLAAIPAQAQPVRTMQFLFGDGQDKLSVTVQYHDPSDVDRRLAGSRVLPVRLSIRNIAAQPIAFTAADVRLNLGGTHLLSPVDPAVVLQELRRTGRVPGLLGFLASQSSAFHRTAIDARQIRDGRLAPGQDRDGFVFFMRPDVPYDPAADGAMYLEAAPYRPQMLETKDIRVKTRPVERRTLQTRWTEFWNTYVRGMAPPFNKSYALLIGIGKYQHLQRLDSPPVDVQKMMDFLVAQGFDEVITVQDESVTLEKLRSPQQYFSNKIQADDRFLFYYSGHGDTLLEHGRLRGYLPLVGDRRGSYSLAMDSLVNWMRALTAKHLLVILDACFSGLAVEGPEVKGDDLMVDREALGRLAQGPARFLLMAGTAGQQAIGDRRWNGSLFTDAMIKGLQENRADFVSDRIVTTRELYVWLKDRVSAEARSVKRELTPLLKDLGPNGVSEGEFVFLRKL